MESTEIAKAETVKQERSRDEERARVRAKLSERDRNFIDKILSAFPGARLVAIRFEDGEQLGVMS